MDMAPTTSMSSMMGVGCLGELLPEGGGTWIGHVIPGTFFMLWGLHWMQAIFRRHIQSQSTGAQFASRPWFSLAGVCRWFHAAEPLLKMLAGPIGVSVELYFDDKQGLRPLYCENGEFAMKYAHNYQHASMYPAFVLSGLVDFIGMTVRLPPGTENVFLGAAFLNEGALMLVHKKHLPLDGVLHQILALCMLATAVGVFAELRDPPSFLVSAFRSFSLTMHGLWMILMGQMLFTGSKSWTDDYTGPAMLAPPAFGMVVLIVAFCFLVIYIILDVIHQRTQKYHTLPQSVKSPRQTSMPVRHSSVMSDDSAIDSEDGLEKSDSMGSSEQGKSLRKWIAPKFKLPLHPKPSKTEEHVV